MTYSNLVLLFPQDELGAIREVVDYVTEQKAITREPCTVHYPKKSFFSALLNWFLLISRIAYFILDALNVNWFFDSLEVQ